MRSDQISFEKLTITRLSFYNCSQKLYIEPRFAANYKFSEIYSVRVATGRFCQFINQVQVPQYMSPTKSFWLLSDGLIHPVVKSDHFIIGSTYESENIVFDIEGYYKIYSGLQEYLYVSPQNPNLPNYFPKNSPNNLTNPGNSIVHPKPTDSIHTQASYFIAGTGKAFGIDFSVRYKFRNFISWVSYSLSKSTQQFPSINQNKEFPSPADQTHQFSWANMLTLNKWNFGTTTLFNTGRPYIDFTQNHQNIPTTMVYKQLPNYFRCDLSCNYNFLICGVKLKTGATIINIFNTKNYFDISTSFSETNIIPAQKLSLNLFVHFVF